MTQIPINIWHVYGIPFNALAPQLSSQLEFYWKIIIIIIEADVNDVHFIAHINQIKMIETARFL